jgi:hypothetical protein
MRYGLYKHIPDSYLQDDRGHWAEAASDRAVMYAAMELAGLDRCKYIRELIYVYRNNTPYTTNRERQKRWDKMLRKKKPLKRLNTVG